MLVTTGFGECVQINGLNVSADCRHVWGQFNAQGAIPLLIQPVGQ